MNAPLYDCCLHCRAIGCCFTSHIVPCESGCNDTESRVHTDHTRALADIERVRAELRRRIDTLDNFETEAALRHLAHHMPDEVNDALDETGARP